MTKNPNKPTIFDDAEADSIFGPSTTGLNPHIQKRLAEKAAEVKSSHSAFWMGDSMDDLMVKVKEGSIEYLERLRKVQRGIGEFVTIITGKEIPVVYSSGEQSYTDGKKVVISADTDPSKLDSMVGTALHEGSHCLLSNESLKFLPVMYQHFPKMIAGSKLPTLAAGLKIPIMPADPAKNQPAMKQGENNGSVYEHVQMVMNVLEDRRIDLWMYRHASGYRPYYEAMYDEYWHSSQIDAALKDKRYHTNYVQNYEMFVINMTNKNFDPKAMTGLDEIRKIANLSDKGLMERGDEDKGWKTYSRELSNGTTTPNLNMFPKLFTDAVKIVEIMYEQSKAVRDPNAPKKEKKRGGGAGDLPNMDGGGMSVSAEELEKALGRQKKFLKGDTEKKALSSNTKGELDQLEATKAEVHHIEGDFIGRGVKAKVIVFREITKKILTSGHFPMSYGGHYGGSRALMANPDGVRALKDGIRMGQILAHRLRVMQDEKEVKYTRLATGRLDKRLISNLGFSTENVFSQTHIEKSKPCDIWLDVDLSGSMQGEKFKQAMTAAVAIAYAADKTRMLNCVIAVRDSGSDAHLAIVYDSRRHRFTKVREVVPYLTAAGGTPEGLCFEAVKEEMLKTFDGERKFFINFSDGCPSHGFMYKGNHYSYGGEPAYKHTRMLMNEFRQAGIKVLSYYIGGDNYEQREFRAMYGQDARFINPNNVSEVVSTLNRLLLA